MFRLFRKTQPSGQTSGQTVFTLLSPLAGDAVPIEQVPDATFADKILGGGIALIPESGVLLAPADGIISSVPDTFHAVMMTTDFGAELLMHIGIDTVELKGQHYRALVSDGERVRTGQPLIEFDRPAIEDAGYAVITPVVITNSDEFRIRQAYAGLMREGAPLLELVKQ